MFFVFERNDGYVGAIKRETVDGGRRELGGWQPSAGGPPITFTILLESEDWDECELLIAHCRALVENEARNVRA